MLKERCKDEDYQDEEEEEAWPAAKPPKARSLSRPRPQPQQSSSNKWARATKEFVEDKVDTIGSVEEDEEEDSLHAAKIIPPPAGIQQQAPLRQRHDDGDDTLSSLASLTISDESSPASSRFTPQSSFFRKHQRPREASISTISPLSTTTSLLTPLSSTSRSTPSTVTSLTSIEDLSPISQTSVGRHRRLLFDSPLSTSSSKSDIIIKGDARPFSEDSHETMTLRRSDETRLQQELDRWISSSSSGSSGPPKQ